MPSGEAPGSLRAVALLALALLILVQNVTPITNNDIFLHLTTGRLVLATGEVPRVDDYSALARGRPFVAHEWLAGVIFRLIEAAAGARAADALILLKAGVAIGVAAILFAAARALGAESAFAIPALALVMTLAAARFLERPHIFSYLMTALFLLVLARRPAGARVATSGLVVLQVLWANLHGSFLLGPGLVALAGVSAAIDRFLPFRAALPPAGAPREERGAGTVFGDAGRLLALAAVLVAACLVNPYGWRLLRFPFELTGSAFMGQIYEWLPPFKSAFASTYMARYYVLWAAIGFLLFAAACGAAVRRRAGPPGGVFPALLFLALFALSLRMNRNVTDFALATVPGVAATATWLWRGPRGEVAGGARRSPLPWMALALALLALWFALHGYAYSPTTRRPFGLGLGRSIPVAAADYLERNGVAGNAFNTYASGAYLVYRLYPAVRVAMDSRNDVYGEDLYAEYTRALADPEALRRMLERIDARFIFLEWPQEGMVRTAAAVRAAGGWTPIYFDDAAVVYARRDGPLGPLVGRDGFAVLDPGLFRPGALKPEEAAKALAEASRAAAAPGGGSYVGRVMKLDALLALGRRSEALEEERLILEENPPLYHIYIYLGLERMAQGDRTEAAERFRRALDLNPESIAARRGLDEAARTR